MFRALMLLLLVLAAVSGASASEFNYTLQNIVVPDYAANDSLYIVPFEAINTTIGVQYPGGNETYNITHDSRTAYSNNSSGIVRIYSSDPVAVYHVAQSGVVYFDNSLSYIIDIQRDVRSTVSIIDYLDEVIEMIGYVIFLIMIWLLAFWSKVGQSAQLLIAMTATLAYILTLLDWLPIMDYHIILMLMVVLMTMNYIMGMRKNAE